MSVGIQINDGTAVRYGCVTTIVGRVENWLFIKMKTENQKKYDTWKNDTC